MQPDQHIPSAARAELRDAPAFERVQRVHGPCVDESAGPEMNVAYARHACFAPMPLWARIRLSLLRLTPSDVREARAARWVRVKAREAVAENVRAVAEQDAPNSSAGARCGAGADREVVLVFCRRTPA